MEKKDWYKKEARLARGIRTLKEVAHFVRCIQIPTDDVDMDEVWSTPNVMLTMRQGYVHDHALLMASMFRAVKYERQDQLKAAFVNRQTRINQTGGTKIQKMIKAAGMSTRTTNAGDPFEDTESADESDDNDDSSDSSEEEKDKDSSDGSSDKKSDAGSEEGKEDLLDSDDISDDGNVGKGSKVLEEIENETIEDRVFVCVGKYKEHIAKDKQAVWVMTFDQDFKVITLWNCVQHKETVLHDRVSKSQIECLKGYLTPFKIQKDIEQYQDKAQKKADDKYRDRIQKWRAEYAEKIE